MTNRLFPSKVLLLGEYTVLSGGDALAIPFLKYGGRWKLNSNLPPIQDDLLKHLEFINDKLVNSLHISKLRRCLREGWRFDSSIPWGKGLGSSAALSASIYWSLTGSEKKKFSNIWHDLTMIEAYFHGKSSGLDTVVSFTNAPTILRNKNELRNTSLPQMMDQMYLYDSQINRETQPLVQWYKYRINNPDFKKAMDRLSRWNADAIKALEKGLSVQEIVNEISGLQYEYLTHLLPPAVNRLWKKTLDDQKIAMKLCGAGGGGYFLVVTSRSAQEIAKSYPKLSEKLNPIK